MDCRQPARLASSVRGILPARILGWAAISFSRGSSRPRDRTHVACLAGGFFATEPPGKPFSSLMNNKASKHSPCQACRTFRRETQPCLDSCGPHSRTLSQTPGWRPTFTPFLPFTLWTTSKDSLFIKVKQGSSMPTFNQLWKKFPKEGMEFYFQALSQG